MQERLCILNKLIRILLVGVFVWGSVGEVVGQIVEFEFSAPNYLAVSNSAGDLSVSNTALSTGTSISTNITTGTYFTNEPYIEASGGWTSNNQATAKNFYFTITADPGFEFSISNVSFNAYATSAGPSAFGFAINSSDIYSVNAPNAVLISVNESVSGQSGLTTATIKIQGWLNGSRSTSGAGVFRLDDIIINGTVSVSSSVSDPDAFTATATSSSQIDLAATANGDGDNILVAWNTTNTFGTPSGSYSIGDPLSGGGTILHSGTAGALPDHSSLTASTTYYYKAWSFDGTDYSTGLTDNATTLCDAFTLPFFEGFEGGDVPPTCWISFENGTGTNTSKNWKIESDPNTGSFSASVDDENVSSSLSSDWLVTPMIDLSTTTNNYLSFYEIDHYINDYGSNYYVKISTLSQSNPSDFTNLVSYGEDEFGDDFQQRIIDLSSYDGEQVFIAFVMEQDDGDGWTIDDVVVDQLKPEPTNHATNFVCTTNGYTGIDVTWDDATGSQVPDGYLVLWSDIDFESIPEPSDLSFIPDGPNAHNIPAGVETYAFTGLTQNTDYFFKIYSYTNSGDYVNYKTDGTIPETACVTDIGPCGYESFSNIPANNSSYITRHWMGNNFQDWTATYARTDQTVNASRAITLNDNGILSNDDAIPGGAGLLTFDYAMKFSGSSILKVFVNNVQYGGDIVVSSSASSTFSAAVNVGGPISVRIENTDNRTAINNLSWICYDDCTPTQTITDFYPIEGPPETLVTIIGTGFIGTTDVQFGGISASIFSIENDTLILASVPENGLSGKIAVSISGCARKSVNDFTVLKTNGQCGIGGSGPTYATDLFVSEVFDATAGSLSYIEIFNGTASTVVLNSVYAIRVTNHGSNGGTSVATYPMTGNLNSGDTYILRLGNNSSACSDFDIDDDRPSAPGFNGDDEIDLLKNGSILDHVPNPNNGPGFDQARNYDVFSPTSTYDVTEWTISTNENCNDLSIPPFDPASDQITINAHPADVDCDDVTFSVDAETTVDPFVPTTYTWRYIAPGDDTWSLVSSLNGSNGLSVTGANTPSITITGNTSILSDYQFYVDMGTGGTGECRRYSHSAQYSFETREYYRTKGSGNWSDVSNWEMSDTEGGTYIDVCQYPVDKTSSKISIVDGQIITLDVEIAADWIDIDPTSTLVLEPNTKLVILDGNPSGADLVVNGTLLDNGNLANGVLFQDDLPTWEMGVDGTLIKTNTSSTSRYRNAYENGIVNIPATATWIYRYTGAGNLSFASSTATIPMFYPNLILENILTTTYSSEINASDVNLSNFAITGSTLMTIKGDFNVGGSGIGNIHFSNVNTGSAPVLIEGELIIKSGSTLNNTGNSSSNGVGFDIQSDMDIEGTLDLSAGSGANVGILKLSGGQDMIGVGSSLVKTNHLVIDKDPGFNILSELSMDIEESATFTQGILELDNPSALLTFKANATTTGASNASFVDGKVVKNRAANESFIFPIGDTRGDTIAWYQPARIFGTSGTSTIEAEYFAEANANAGAYYDGDSNTPGDNQEISNCDYWTINKLSGDNVKLALKWNNQDPEYCNVVGDTAHVFLYSYNTAPMPAVWDYVASGNMDDEIVSISFIGTAGSGNYGDFALGGTSQEGLNVLPITLVSFTATPKESHVVTSWITASEKNNDYFTLERSADATNFKSVATIEGAGTSRSMLAYAHVDHAPLSGISYYRLMQTDFDGTTSYSEIRSVEFYSSGTFSFDMAYRSEDGLSLAFTGTAPYLTVEIFDVFGQLVYGGIVENYGGRAVVSPHMSRGVYVVRLSQGSVSASRKVFW